MATSREIEAQAANWLARRDSSGWSAADNAAFTAWLAESTAHKVAFVRLEAAWNASLKLKPLGAGIPKGEVPAPGVWRRRRFAGRQPEVRSLERRIDARVQASSDSRRRRGGYALAASLVLGLTLGGIWLLRPEGTTYHTAIGGLAAVPMRDGSQVTLNTDTDIRVSLTPSERRVDLDHGEAFFEVAHDARRPFIVLAGDKRVVAVGTKFSVRRDGEDVWVVVTEGKVRVESDRGPDAAPVALVAAGSIARVQGAGVLVSPENSVDAEAALSWRHGYVVLHDTPIAEAAAEFNRYNTKKIMIADPSIGDIRIGGNFRSTSTDAFVRLLANGFPIRVEERDQEIVLMKK